jgi:hypothetical protein
MKLSIIALSLGVIFDVLAASNAKEAQFFSGIYLLQSLPGLSNTERTRKFHELELLTGIDAKKAEAYLSSFRVKPAEWRKLCDSMIPMITGAQVKISVPAAPKDHSFLPGVRK